MEKAVEKNESLLFSNPQIFYITLGTETSNQATAAEVGTCLLWRCTDILFKKATGRWRDEKEEFILAKDLVKFLSVNSFMLLHYDKNKILISSVQWGRKINIYS